MKPEIVIDTDKQLQCRACLKIISRVEAKVIIGAKIRGRQVFHTFHGPCWEFVRGEG